MFNVIDMRNGSSSPLSWNTSKNGDWHLEANTSTLYYLGMYSLGRRKENFVANKYIVFSI